MLLQKIQTFIRKLFQVQYFDKIIEKIVKCWTFPLTLVILGIPVFQINLLDQDVM